MSLIRVIILLLVILFFCLLPVGCGPAPDKGELILTEAPAPSLEHALLDGGGPQPLMVYLPAAYRDGRSSFPVLYYLPGFTTDVTEYLDQSFQGFNLQVAMDELIRLGRIRPMIVVVLNGRNFLGGSFYVNSPVTGGWEDYVARDVVGYVDRTWRTVASPRGRGLAGDSVGGSGALLTAMAHPEIFGSVYALSPGLLPRPGVLREWLYADAEMIRDDLRILGELAGLEPGEARARFRGFIGDLYRSGGREGYFRAFAWAYGAAFAPDAAGGPPWIGYPFRERDGEVAVDPVVMARWDRGLGDLDGKVRHHAGALRRLGGLVLDYGRKDPIAWIPEGVERFSALLTEAGVPHEVRAHDGTHVGSLRVRFEYELLPFFSEVFGLPPAARAAGR